MAEKAEVKRAKYVDSNPGKVRAPPAALRRIEVLGCFAGGAHLSEFAGPFRIEPRHMRFAAIVDARGCVTVPRDTRKQFRLGPSDRLRFAIPTAA